MVSKNQDPNAVLNALKQITASKTPKTKSVSSNIGKSVVGDSWLTGNLLKQLDENPYRKPGKFFPKGPQSSTNQELFDAISTIKQGEGAMGILTTLDTPKRAVISSIREVVDALDFKDETKASFSDWKKQTLDREFGYGRAFPISSSNVVGRWAGRTVGLVGDLIFDPVNWATLGGAIPVKAVIKMSAKEFADAAATGAARKYVVKKVLDDGSVLINARSAMGKHVIGRDGRNALARFSRQRLTALRNEGVVGYENLTDDMITQAYAKISARGKSELFNNPNIPKGFAESIGVRSPGVYYFGSRIKVPLTGPIGELTEESLTELRLFLSNTKGGKAFRRVATPGGVGRISRFGTQEADKEGKIVVRNAIKDARVNLADGSLIEPEEIRRAMIVVEGHDIGRLRNTVHVENESINFAPLVDELAAVEGGHKYLDMIPRADLEGMVPYDPDASIALRVRDYMDSLWKKVNDRGAEVGAAPIPYREGYFTHLETVEAQRLRLKIGDDAFEDLISPVNKAKRLSNRAQRRNVFRGRTLEDGQDFFGVKLIESGPDANMDVDSLNRIFREKGGFDFNLFQNDTAAVLAEYLHQFADQMAWYDTLEYITKNYPEYLGFGETLAKISTSYERQIMVDAPNQAFNQLQNAIRSHSIFLEDALNSVRSELLQKFQSFDSMLKSLEDGTISQKTLDDLFESLNEQIAIAGGLEAEYRSMLSTVSSSMENLDGVGGFDLFFQNSNVLSGKFDEIKKLAETIKATPKTDPKYNEMISDLYKQVENYEAAVSTFSRNLEFASVVSDVFPALSDIGKYGASEQYDIFTKIIDEIGGVNPASAARGRAEGFGPRNARRFGWKESDVVAVSRVTQEDVRSILGDVRSGLVPEKTGDAMSAKIALLSKYVKSIIVENEFLGGDTVSAFLRDERTGLRASKSAGPLDKNIRVNKETLYGQYAKAVESLKAGDVKPMENLIIQQQALSQIHKWEEMFAPFGITIGDDVIDEIVQREAREYAIIALRNNDDKRFAELTSGDFGRQDGTGPLGTHRMIERKRVIAEENIKQSKWRIPMKLSDKKVSPEQARKIDKDVFLRRMSPEQRSTWGRVRAENTKLIEYTQKRIEELKQLMLKPDQQAVSQEAVWDSAENSFGNVIRFLDSGELFGIVNDSATGNFVLYNDLINYLHDIAREHPLMSDNWPAFLETVTKNIEEFAILNQYTNPTSKLYGQQKFELRQAITDALLSESANSKVIYFSSVRSQDDSVVAEMLRLTKLQVSAQETLNNPQEYFQRGVGRIELDARNNRLRPTPRPLDEGGMVVDARTGELVAPTKSELDIKLAEYRNSEQHDIAFGVQTNVNSAYVLAYLNLDKMPAEYMPGGISFTTEEWDKIVNGDFIETGSGKFHTFITALRRDREIYLESSYLGDDVSDVKLLEGFVDFVIANFRDTDAVVLSDEVIKFRRKSLDRAFKRSEHWAWLEDFSTLEQRKFAEAYVRDSADEVRQLDLLTNTVNQIEELAVKQVTDTAEYGPNARARLSEAINDLLKNKGNVKRVNKAESKLARDNEGVLETTFLGRLGEGKEVANIESLPIKGIDNVDITVLARNKRAGETIDLYLSAPNIEKIA